MSLLWLFRLPIWPCFYVNWNGLSICPFYHNHHLFLPQCVPAFMGEKERLDPKLVGRQSQDTLTWAQSLVLRRTRLWTRLFPGCFRSRSKQRNYKKMSHTVCCCCYWPHLAWCCFSLLVITAVLVMTAAILRDTQYINRLWALIPEHNLLFRLQMEAVSSITSRKKTSKHTVASSR